MKRFTLRLRPFLQDTEGAVTVDWVVLTAAIVSMAGVTMTAIKGGMDTIGDRLSAALENIQVSTK